MKQRPTDDMPYHQKLAIRNMVYPSWHRRMEYVPTSSPASREEKEKKIMGEKQEYPYTTESGRRVKFLYFTVGTHRVTAAYYVESENLWMSYSTCSHRDQFSKHRARQITTGRLETGKSQSIPDDREHRYELIIAGYDQYAELFGLPLN